MARSVLETPRAGPQRESSLGFPRGLVGRPSRAPRLGGFARRRERRHRGSPLRRLDSKLGAVEDAQPHRRRSFRRVSNRRGHARSRTRLPRQSHRRERGVHGTTSTAHVRRVTEPRPPRPARKRPRGKRSRRRRARGRLSRREFLVGTLVFRSARLDPRRAQMFAPLRKRLQRRVPSPGRARVPPRDVVLVDGKRRVHAPRRRGFLRRRTFRLSPPRPFRRVRHRVVRVRGGSRGPGRRTVRVRRLSTRVILQPRIVRGVRAVRRRRSLRVAGRVVVRRVSSRNVRARGFGDVREMRRGNVRVNVSRGRVRRVSSRRTPTRRGRDVVREMRGGIVGVDAGFRGVCFCPAGAFSSAAGSTTCESCPAGTWQNATGQTACADCPAGTANAAEGANEVAACAPCPPGTSTGGDRAAAACGPCAAGTYAGPTPGAERCAPAPMGHRVANVGAVAPERCPAGAYAPNAGAEECLPCPANQYREDSSVFPEDEAAEAAEAEAETAADATTAEASSEEASETSTEASETSTSDPYSASIFHNDGSSCAACPSGARSDAGWSRCECLPGHAPSAVSGGGLRCDACAPGTFLDLITSTCAVCPAGTFAPANASVACAPFSPGSVGSEYVEPDSYRGAAAQRLCDAGSVPRRVVVRLAVVSLCAPCPAGTISSAAGAVNCTACALGSAPNPERTACASGNDALDWSSTDGHPPTTCPVTSRTRARSRRWRSRRRGGERSRANRPPPRFSRFSARALWRAGGRRVASTTTTTITSTRARTKGIVGRRRGGFRQGETRAARDFVRARGRRRGGGGARRRRNRALDARRARGRNRARRARVRKIGIETPYRRLEEKHRDVRGEDEETFVETFVRVRFRRTRRRRARRGDGVDAAEAAERRVSARYRAASVAAAAAAQNRRRKANVTSTIVSTKTPRATTARATTARVTMARATRTRSRRRVAGLLVVGFVAMVAMVAIRRDGRDGRDRRWFRRDRRWFRRDRRDRRAGEDAAEEAAAAAAEAVRVAVRSASVSYRDAGYSGSGAARGATPEDRTNASNEAAGTALPRRPR